MIFGVLTTVCSSLSATSGPSAWKPYTQTHPPVQPLALATPPSPPSQSMSQSVTITPKHKRKCRRCLLGRGHCHLRQDEGRAEIWGRLLRSSYIASVYVTSRR